MPGGVGRLATWLSSMKGISIRGSRHPTLATRQALSLWSTMPSTHNAQPFSLQNHPRFLALSSSKSSSESSLSEPRDDTVPLKLIIYSKQDCPLCDKLKEKLDAIVDRASFVPTSVMRNVEIEVRDITTNPAWEARYAMSIPVLTTANVDGNEVRVVGIALVCVCFL